MATAKDVFLLTPPGGGDPESPVLLGNIMIFLLTPPGGGDPLLTMLYPYFATFLLTPPGGGDRWSPWPC